MVGEDRAESTIGGDLENGAEATSQTNSVRGRTWAGSGSGSLAFFPIEFNAGGGGGVQCTEMKKAVRVSNEKWSRKAVSAIQKEIMPSSTSASSAQAAALQGHPPIDDVSPVITQTVSTRPLLLRDPCHSSLTPLIGRS